jgi:hypothetical protein
LQGGILNVDALDGLLHRHIRLNFQVLHQTPEC